MFHLTLRVIEQNIFDFNDMTMDRNQHSIMVGSSRVSNGAPFAQEL